MSNGELVKFEESIRDKIYSVRGYQVMLDRDLAPLYQTDTRTLKQAVKRNIEKFPDDFLFILNESEITLMVSRFVIPSKQILGGAAPFAFTEQGVAMLAGVLKSDIAVKISIRVIRAFIEMRKFIQFEAKMFTLAHDRFIIIDDKDVYHFGASLKDLGKKWFAFSKIEKSDLELLSKQEKY